MKLYPKDQKERVLRKLLELSEGRDAPEGAITKLAEALQLEHLSETTAPLAFS